MAVSKFIQAVKDINDDYPRLLDQYLWYFTLPPEEKKLVLRDYKSMGFNRTHWTGDINRTTFIPVEGLNNVVGGGSMGSSLTERVGWGNVVNEGSSLSERVGWGNVVNDQGYEVKADRSYSHKDFTWSCTIRHENDGHIPSGMGFHISMGYSFSLQIFLLDGEEQHWIPDRNACGPGTKIELRLSKYWPILPLLIFLCGYKMKGTYPWNKPINETDECCMKHDQEYSLPHQSSKDIQMADWAMLYCMEHRSKGDTYDERMKDYIIQNAIRGKGYGEWVYGTKGWYGLVTEKYKPRDDLEEYEKHDKLPKTYGEFKEQTNNASRIAKQYASDHLMAKQLAEQFADDSRISLLGSKSIGKKRKKPITKRKKPSKKYITKRKKRKKPITKRKKHSKKL